LGSIEFAAGGGVLVGACAAGAAEVWANAERPIALPNRIAGRPNVVPDFIVMLFSYPYGAPVMQTSTLEIRACGMPNQNSGFIPYFMNNLE
jgi:hypothetical protein